ncbi:hypothetical protein [Phocaeicola sp.]
MIIPPFRLYHFAVKLIWKHMLVLTLVFWVGLITIYYVVNDAAIWNEYGWWLLLMIIGTYFLFMDVKLMLMIMRHEEKKKWKHYKLKSN